LCLEVGEQNNHHVNANFLNTDQGMAQNVRPETLTTQGNAKHTKYKRLIFTAVRLTAVEVTKLSL
jgi:hypothetical protein